MDKLQHQQIHPAKLHLSTEQEQEQRLFCKACLLSFLFHQWKSVSFFRHTVLFRDIFIFYASIFHVYFAWRHSVSRLVICIHVTQNGGQTPKVKFIYYCSTTTIWYLKSTLQLQSIPVRLTSLLQEMLLYENNNWERKIWHLTNVERYVNEFITVQPRHYPDHNCLHLSQ